MARRSCSSRRCSRGTSPSAAGWHRPTLPVDGRARRPCAIALPPAPPAARPAVAPPELLRAAVVSARHSAVHVAVAPPAIV
eukprot:1864537-Prymnesium_polylepis.1